MREDLLRRWLGTDPNAYDRMVEEARMAAYFATIDAPLLAACQGRVLELACGTGRFLRLLASRPQVQHVVGLDIAPRMLEAAAAEATGCWFERRRRISRLLPTTSTPFSARSTPCVTWSGRRSTRRCTGCCDPAVSSPSRSEATTQRISRHCGGSLCVAGGAHARGGLLMELME